MRRFFVCLIGLASLAGLFVGLWIRESLADDKNDKTPATKSEATYRTESLRGRVVWLAEAMKRRFGIDLDADAAQWDVALETTDGQLLPIVKDARGRGFRLDPRLRDVDMELLVRRYEGSPMIQIIRVYTLKKDGKYELDYWCDICAIPMYELKDCECCQGPIRLRERREEEKK
jgi:hypothetical protein